MVLLAAAFFVFRLIQQYEINLPANIKDKVSPIKLSYKANNFIIIAALRARNLIRSITAQNYYVTQQGFVGES